jgi:hypothetical protein
VGKQVQEPDRAADSRREAKALHRNELTDNQLDIGSCSPSSSGNVICAFILLDHSSDSGSGIALSTLKAGSRIPSAQRLPPRAPCDG